MPRISLVYSPSPWMTRASFKLVHDFTRGWNTRDHRENLTKEDTKKKKKKRERILPRVNLYPDVVFGHRFLFSVFDLFPPPHLAGARAEAVVSSRKKGRDKKGRVGKRLSLMNTSKKYKLSRRGKGEARLKIQRGRRHLEKINREREGGGIISRVIGCERAVLSPLDFEFNFS